MKKSILNIGSAINKAEQKQIQGGCGQGSAGCYCSDADDCYDYPGHTFTPWECINGYCVIS